LETILLIIFNIYKLVTQLIYIKNKFVQESLFRNRNSFTIY